MQENDDPRMRYYFYRQVRCTPGATCLPDGDGQNLQCSLQVVPNHYQAGGFTWCFLENGYWGRDHGNDEGGPPDGFLKTAPGVYPAFGLFDDHNISGTAAIEGVNLGLGGGGAGITPIILASYIDFMRAEVALKAGDASGAATHLKNGITKSVAKAKSFISADSNADNTLEPSATVITAFIDAQVSAFNAAAAGPAKWNILAQQYWVALYGGATDAFNFYRRTGFPTTLQPNVEPNPGVLPRTFLFPGNEVSANPNVTQKPDHSTQVFWDTQPAGPAFPPSN